jgi:hypothetical protein
MENMFFQPSVFGKREFCRRRVRGIDAAGFSGKLAAATGRPARPDENPLERAT